MAKLFFFLCLVIFLEVLKSVDLDELFVCWPFLLCFFLLFATDELSKPLEVVIFAINRSRLLLTSFLNFLLILGLLLNRSLLQLHPYVIKPGLDLVIVLQVLQPIRISRLSAHRAMEMLAHMGHRPLHSRKVMVMCSLVEFLVFDVAVLFLLLVRRMLSVKLLPLLLLELLVALLFALAGVIAFVLSLDALLF